MNNFVLFWFVFFFSVYVFAFFRLLVNFNFPLAKLKFQVELEHNPFQIIKNNPVALWRTISW